MSLTVALNNARSSLAATTTQINVSGKNIAGASDPAYSRKLALTSTTADGGARIISIGRATNASLYDTMLGATSSAAGQRAIVEGLDRLSAAMGDPEAQQSPAARLGALAEVLQQHANAPDDMLLAQVVLDQAQGLAASLNEGANTVLTVKSEADAAIAASVSRTNDLLARFQALNQSVVKGTITGADVTTELDQRDAVMAALSEEMGISAISRPNNDLALYTDGGVTLFDTTARTVSFQPTAVFTPGTTGNAVVIDGVTVTGENATMPLRSGGMVGLTTLRDDVAGSFQNQLDEVARGLVASFAETDQSGSGLPDRAGLFTYAGGPGVPPAATLSTGLASTIRVHPAVSAPGGVSTLRDGGMNGADYVYNDSAGASFRERLQELADVLNEPTSFTTDAGLPTPSSLRDYSAASVGWVEAQRQNAVAAETYQTTLLARTSEALSNATGVNMDDEYATQLQLEQSYAASAKLIAVISQMFDTLLGAVR